MIKHFFKLTKYLKTGHCSLFWKKKNSIFYTELINFNYYLTLSTFFSSQTLI